MQKLDNIETAIKLAGEYFQAMINADATELRRIFHPNALIIGKIDHALDYMTLEGFVEDTKDAKTGDQPFDYKVDSCTIFGDTANVIVTGYCYGAWITDYLSMIETDGTWQIVSKTYYIHP